MERIERESPYDFNPRSCTRSDRASEQAVQYFVKFQPTLLYEERLTYQRMVGLSPKFQPTLLYEERLFKGANQLRLLLPISTHAPVRGATPGLASTRLI